MWRILYVEDSSDSLELLSFVLNSSEDEEFMVEGAGSADEAIEKISSKPFDLYILDRWMPGMDGAELCQWIREQGDLSPVVFYSGAVREADKAEAFDAGADRYLTKPTDLFRIEHVVRELLNESQTARFASV
jgi:DNA-binding response OmpR family regulator